MGGEPTGEEGSHPSREDPKLVAGIHHDLSVNLGCDECIADGGNGCGRAEGNGETGGASSYAHGEGQLQPLLSGVCQGCIGEVTVCLCIWIP